MAEPNTVVIQVEDDEGTLNVVRVIIAQDPDLRVVTLRQFTTASDALVALADDELLKHPVAAIIDGIVNDGTADPVAQKCHSAGIPYVRHTGEAKGSVFTEGGLYLKKPVRNQVLVEALKQCLATCQISQG